MTSILDWI